MQIGIGLGIPATHGNIAGFTPLELSPTLWIDASDTSTITEVAGAVSQIDDKSGNGNNLTQATAALQPTTGIATINGLNVLSVDNDSILSPSIAFTGLTMLAVFSHTLEAFALLGTNLDTFYAGSGVSGSASTTLAQNMGTLSLRFDGVAFTGTTRDQVYTAMDGATRVVYLSVDGSFTRNLNPFSYTLDLSRPVGAIAEIIVVNGTLTASEIAATEQYLADKWGITI